MTAHEFIAIFQKRKQLCITIIAGALLFSLAVYRLQEDSYRATFILSVTRTPAADATPFQYDEFYRLQADERFADTLVRYLETDGAKRDITGSVPLTASENAFFLNENIQATRLSSQIISIELRGKTVKSLQGLTGALTDVTNRYTEKLNRVAQDPHWFMVLGSDPVIGSAKYSWRILLLIGLTIGLFLAFWTSLIAHFFSEMPRSHESR